MKMSSTPEFDAFGPWIYEIDDVILMPSIFKDYNFLIKKALMVFKIPRKIDRRVANPSMHLYDMIVSVFQRELVVLLREGDTVKKMKIAISDISAIKRTECLLDGCVELYIMGDVIAFDYNTVSSTIINDFVILIRSLQRRSNKSLTLPPISFDSSTLDMPYFALISRIIATEPDFKLIAYQPSIDNPKNSKWLKRIKRIFKDDSFANDDVVCSSSVFISNTKQLIVINRNRMQNDEGSQNYSYSFLYLSIDCIKRSKIELFSKTPFFERFVIETQGQEFSCIINDTNKNIGKVNDKLKHSRANTKY